jgi:hypothetical protein
MPTIIRFRILCLAACSLKTYRTVKVLSVILHVRNFVSDNTERTQADGFERQVAEEHIWDLSGRN